MCTTLTPFIFRKLRASIKGRVHPKNHQAILTLISLKNSFKNFVRLWILLLSSIIYLQHIYWECGRREGALPLSSHPTPLPLIQILQRCSFLLMLSKLLWLLVYYNDLINNDEHCWVLYANVLWFIRIPYWCANDGVNGYAIIYMNSS